MKFRTKLLYLVASISVAMLGLLARLYAMQISGAERYEIDSEAVGRRVNLTFPARAAITDRNGDVLVENDSRWELEIDCLRFCAPEGAARRAQLDPTAWPDPSEACALQVTAQDIEAATFPSPATVRRFFAGWQLRSNPVARRDHERSIQRLCAIAGLDPIEVGAKLALVDAEVDAIVHAAISTEAAPRAVLLKAYRRARQAAADPEYWERIRRFPHSLALEPLLAARLDGVRQRGIILTAIRSAVKEHPNVLREILSAALHNARERSIAADDQAFDSGASNGTALAVSGAPAAERASAWSAERPAMWTKLAEDLSAVNTMDGSAVEPALDALVARTELESTRIEQRLANLRSRVIAPWIEDYRTRWIQYLAAQPNGQARGTSNQARLTSNPLKLGEDLSRQTADALTLCSDVIEGLHISPRMLRHQTDARLLPHLIGAVGLPDSERLDAMLREESALLAFGDLIERWYGGDEEAFEPVARAALAGQPLGISGIELAFDSALRGVAGARVSLVDARGTLRSIEGEWPAGHAAPLRLTVDRKLQEFAMTAVRRWEPRLRESAVQRSAHDAWAAVGGESAFALRGAIVLLDAKTGAILALLNFPSYDPELLAADSPEGEAYRKRILHGDDALPPARSWLRESPMLNRSVSGAYAPGSTFKILSSIAMLESKTLTARSRFNEGEGKAVVQGRGFKLTTYHGAGDVDLEGAIAHSSNGYFWHYSELMPGASPAERFSRVLEPWSRTFGFGEIPGVELTGQSRGKLPNPRTVSASDLAQLCIGQGRMLASPLQVARFMAAVANRGKLPTPHLALDSDLSTTETGVTPSTWTIVIEGMKDVVSSGTAAKSRICKRLNVAAKTGTAQIGHFTDARGTRHEIPTHAWFAGFAPAEKPKIAFAVLAEYSGLYGGDLADLTGEILEFALR